MKENLLFADELLDNLEVWATLVFEEFWEGYGMGGGIVYQNAENHPHPQLLAAIAARGIGLNSSKLATNQLLITQEFQNASTMIDYEGYETLEQLLEVPQNPNTTLLNFLTFADLYELLQSNRTDSLFVSGQLQKPSGHQIWSISLTDYLPEIDWMLFQEIVTFGHLNDGFLDFPLYSASESSLTLRLSTWGKVVPTGVALNRMLLNDLKFLAKLGITNLDYGLFFDYGFTALNEQQWQVTAAPIDYTAVIRDFADEVRQFTQLANARGVGMKMPKILVVNPPFAKTTFLRGKGLSAGDFWIDEPTRVVLAGDTCPGAFLIGE